MGLEKKEDVCEKIFPQIPKKKQKLQKEKEGY